MDYSELKKLASAAKNWGGEIGEDHWYEAECFKKPYFSVPDAEFIGSCDPGTILSLIAERDQLKAENEALRKDAERWRYARDRLQRFSLTAKPQHESVAIGHDKWIDSRMELEALSAQLK